MFIISHALKLGTINVSIYISKLSKQQPTIFCYVSAQFTQLIWKDTRFLGVAYAEYESTDEPRYVKTIVVAQYYPGGNKQGKFHSNVQKPITDLKTESKLSRAIRKFQRNKMKEQAHLIMPTG